MYSSVAVLLRTVAPLASSLETAESGTGLHFWQPLKSLQPRVHQMGASGTPLIKKGVHGDFPEPRKFWFTLANAGDRQTVVSEAIVQSIGPESICVLLCDGNGGRCGRVVGELSLIEELQSICGEVEEWSTETLDRSEWDTGESVEGNDVSVNFLGRGSSDMGHSRISGSHELGEPNEHMIGNLGWPPRLHKAITITPNRKLPRGPENQREKERRRTYVWSAISLPATYQSVTRV